MWLWVAFGFFVHTVFALGMMVGYYTKFCTFMTWFMLLSLQNRMVREK